MTREDSDLRALFHDETPQVRPVDVAALIATAGRRFESITKARSNWKRSLIMPLRVTAGVLAVACFAGLVALLVSRDSAAEMTLAEVQATVTRTQTMSCKSFRRSVPAAKESDEPHRMLILGPSVVRIEQADGKYAITDFNRRQSLLVDPAKKTAIVLHGLNYPAGLPVQNFYELFRSIASKPVKTLPERLMDGRKTMGFEVRNPLEGAARQPEPPDAKITVWVDQETKLPVRIETVTRENNSTTTDVMEGIVFDRPLDHALFALTPPPGYVVDTTGVAELQPVPDPKEKTAAKMVVTPLVGLGPVKFNMNVEGVIERLGKPDKTVSPNKDYTLLEYYSRGFSIHATTQRGVIMIMCYNGRFWAFRVREFAGQTDKGIKLGDSRSAIEKAHGKPSSVRESTLKDVFGKSAAEPEKKTGQVELFYDDLRLSLSLHDDAVDTITITAPRPQAAAGNQPAKK
jgi:outer membrane lipoprotein-sorting protein